MDRQLDQLAVNGKGVLQRDCIPAITRWDHGINTRQDAGIHEQPFFIDNQATLTPDGKGKLKQDGSDALAHGVHTVQDCGKAQLLLKLLKP